MFSKKTQTFRVYDPSSVEKKSLYSTTQYDRHHKNDRSRRTRNCARRMYITSQFKWNWNWYSVLSAERCLFENSTASHVAFAECIMPHPLTWTSEILWPVELKCWATGQPRKLRIRLIQLVGDALTLMEQSSFNLHLPVAREAWLFHDDRLLQQYEELWNHRFW